MNPLINTLTFFHEGQVLTAEVEYTVDERPERDKAVVIGEITNNTGDVFEVKDRIICAEFHAAFWSEVEDERREIVMERARFKGVFKIGKAEEKQLL